MTNKPILDKERASQPKKPVAQKEPLLAVRIGQFEKLVHAKDYDGAHDILIKILTKLEGTSESFGSNLVEVTTLMEQQATIFCAAVTHLLSDREFVVNDGKFFGLTALKRPLTQSFEISGYRGTSHLIQLMGTPDGKGGTTLTRQEILKLFIGLSINALSPNLVDMLLRQIPNIAWPLCVGFLSEQIVYSPLAKAARAKILAASDHLKKASPNFATVRNLGPAYMGCSYDESVHKHDIKHAMNAVVRRWLVEQGVEDTKLPDERRAVKKRPTLLIMAELYDSKHAMHRCYGPSIASLKPYFKIILMTPTGSVDQKLTGMFDKIDSMKFEAANPKPFIDKAKSYRPDMVYFPSIGMRLMSIVASNVRIAPIQMFTPGHPATTRSDCIDYWVLVDGYVGSETLFSETVLAWKSQPYFSMRGDAKTVKPNIKPAADVIRVAVPAWSRKVAPGFIEACKRIAKASEKKLEFVFFPNGAGALYQSFSRRMEAELNAIVLPRSNYNHYIQNLNNCDLYLSTFPFGSTNGLVDGLRQGLPVVNLVGDECHGKIDSDILRAEIQPDWLSASSVDAYVDAAVRLINDDALRIQVSKQVLSSNVDQYLLLQDESPVPDFVNTFRLAYEKHEEIQRSGKKVWHVDPDVRVKVK